MFYPNRQVYRKQVAQAPAQVSGDPVKITALKDSLQHLWTDYAWRNRAYLVNLSHPLADHAVTRAWALQNIDQMRLEIFNNYYTEEIGTQFSSHMTACLDSMVSVINYLINMPDGIGLGKDAFLERLKASWRTKSDALYNFLANLNSKSWNTPEMRGIIDDLQNLWTNQIVSRLRAEWALDMSYADQTFRVSEKMGRVMSDGILEQNPGKFV